MNATIAITAVLALLGIVGRLDYEDQLAEQAVYCEMVKAGEWPDYQKTYLTECVKTPTVAQR